MKRFQANLYTVTLSMLLGLFVFRVAAQFVQHISYVSWLPAFESWHSATLPYWLLFLSQLLIIVLEAKIIYGIATRSRKNSAKRGQFYLSCGILYFCAMIFRLIGGQTFLASFSWFKAWLPATFHLVLAIFLIVNGHSHLSLD